MYYRVDVNKELLELWESDAYEPIYVLPNELKITIMQWLYDNHIDSKYYSRTILGQTYFFEKEEHAIQFSLVWG